MLVSSLVLLMLAASAECGAPGPLASSPCTVPAGYVQVEGDFASFAFEHGPPRARSLAVGPLVAKIPITGQTHVEVSMAPYVATVQRVPGQASERSSQPPGALGVRANRSLHRGARYSASLQPGIRIPLDGRVVDGLEFGIGAPIAVALRDDWSLTLNPTLMLRPHPGEVRVGNLLGLSRPVGGGWVVLAEWTSLVDPQGDTRPQHSLIFGADYTPKTNPALHIDIGGGIGLSSSAPDALIYVSFSTRMRWGSSAPPDAALWPDFERSVGFTDHLSLETQ